VGVRGCPSVRFRRCRQWAFQGNAAFYDPGLGVGQSIPQEVANYTGSGVISDVVNGVSGRNPGIQVPGCGHDVVCAIQHSPALQAALAMAGPCNHPRVFARSFFTVVFNFPSRFMPLPYFSSEISPVPPDPLPNGSGTATILPGFTIVDDDGGDD
jgi:hypothetical protein